MTAVVEGHCATYGTARGRDALSLARAEAVKSFLSAHDIDSRKITTIGDGSRRPQVPDTRPDGSLIEQAAQQNRRIVITVER